LRATEVLLFALVTASLYFLAHLVLRDRTNALVRAGLFGGLVSLTRSDGWAPACL
jgi:hypothetical protein